MHGQPCCCPAAAEILGWPPERWRGLQVAGGRPRAARCLHGAWQTTPGSSHAAGNFRRARGWTGSNYQWDDAGDCRPSVSLPCVRPAVGQGPVAMRAPARAAVAFQSCKRSSCGVGAVPRVPVPQPFVARGERVCFRPCAAIVTKDRSSARRSTGRTLVRAGWVKRVAAEESAIVLAHGSIVCVRVCVFARSDAVAQNSCRHAERGSSTHDLAASSRRAVRVNE